MAKKEVKTDLWVYDLLKDAGISTLEPQGSTIKEINNALKTASKKGTGKVGFPEYVGPVKDYLLVIEDKAALAQHIYKDDKGLISADPKIVQNYAVNGALFYANILAAQTTYKKVIAFGVSGNEKRHRISPIFVDGTEYYRELPDVESFIIFNETNIDEYYVREVLKETTDIEKETTELLKDAAELHESLRNYGSLKDIDKPLVVSGILLALREGEHHNFSVDDLMGDTVKTDGQKIYNAIEANLQRSNVAPEVKKDKLLSQFAIIRDTVVLNEVNPTLGKTPLKYYTEFLNEHLYRAIRYSTSGEDYIGRFYGEFMSYSGGDGQNLGIILTPKHITELFCDLVDIKPTDVVLDPCCGTAGFLIAAMHRMLGMAKTTKQKRDIRQLQLHGIEMQSYMFTIATTNMILRGDGKSNLINEDFTKQDACKLQLKQATVGLMNPPYSQGSKENTELYELAFVEHLLDSLSENARCAVIIPQSSITCKTQIEQDIKTSIMKKHTLEGVITLSKNTFYGVGVTPCIVIFTAHQTHPHDKICTFINFENDGYKVAPHIGLVETESAKDKKQHMLDVWYDRVEDTTDFCVKTTVKADDEWLHSYFYFDDTLPSDDEFEKVISNYMTFEYSMILSGRTYLFNTPNNGSDAAIEFKQIPKLSEKDWKDFFITDLFTDEIQRGKRLIKDHHVVGNVPYVSSSAMNNGVDAFIGNTEKVRRFCNCLSLANSGSVGSCFFEPFEFVASDHITHLKNDAYDKYVYLFMATMLNRLSAKYNFNREINDSRISREKIMLPVMESDTHKPDISYMRQYIRNLIKEKRQIYTAFYKQTKPTKS